MTTIANIAQRILDENGYNIADFSGLTLTILEYKIDDAIDYVNSVGGLSIANLSGTAGSKSFVYTAGQNIPVKNLTNLMLKAYKEKGNVGSISGISINFLLENPDYKLSMMLISNSINSLKTPPIYVANEALPDQTY